MNDKELNRHAAVIHYAANRQGKEVVISVAMKFLQTAVKEKEKKRIKNV